jgi:hypothetical protein
MTILNLAAATAHGLSAKPVIPENLASLTIHNACAAVGQPDFVRSSMQRACMSSDGCLAAGRC